MGCAIYCETKETTSPYIFTNTRIAVYSYEEVCYYIFQHSSMISMQYLGEEFIAWVANQLEMKELAEALHVISQNENALFPFLKTFLLAANYFTKNEVALLFERMKQEESLPYVLQLKKQADGYLNLHKYVRAIRIYDSILKEQGLDDEFRAIIYHNKGVALCKNFSILAAAECFKKAYITNENELSLGCYLSIYFMMNEWEKAQAEAIAFGVEETVYKRIEAEYKRTEDGYEQTKAYEIFAQAMQDKKYGQDAKAQKQINELMQEWKEEYRIQTT